MVDLFQSHYVLGMARTGWSQPLESSWESRMRSAGLGSIFRCRDIHGYLVALVLAWLGEVQGHYSCVPRLSLCWWHHSCVRTLQTQVAVNWFCDRLLLPNLTHSRAWPSSSKVTVKILIRSFVSTFLSSKIIQICCICIYACLHC